MEITYTVSKEMFLWTNNFIQARYDQYEFLSKQSKQSESGEQISQVVSGTKVYIIQIFISILTAIFFSKFQIQKKFILS